MSVEVEIYTKGWCSYCARAKRLLTEKGVDFVDHDLDATPALRAEMIDRSGGGTTVPQIFINGRHVGGSDDLMALERNGDLDALLAA